MSKKMPGCKEERYAMLEEKIRIQKEEAARRYQQYIEKQNEQLAETFKPSKDKPIQIVSEIEPSNFDITPGTLLKPPVTATNQRDIEYAAKQRKVKENVERKRVTGYADEWERQKELADISAKKYAEQTEAMTDTEREQHEQQLKAVKLVAATAATIKGRHRDHSGPARPLKHLQPKKVSTPLKPPCHATSILELKDTTKLTDAQVQQRLRQEAKYKEKRTTAQVARTLHISELHSLIDRPELLGFVALRLKLRTLDDLISCRLGYFVRLCRLNNIEFTYDDYLTIRNELYTAYRLIWRQPYNIEEVFAHE